jgi:regulatory protein
MAMSRTSRAPDPRQRADPAAARSAAIALLARRDFSCTELGDRLIRRGFDAGAAQEVVAELAREGVLDEERYAHNYVAYHAGRGQGPIRIAAELRRHGLPVALIEAALAAGPDWRALAGQVRRARFGPQPPSGWAQQARQARFLQYRGFSSDHIRAAAGTEPDTGLTDP